MKTIIPSLLGLVLLATPAAQAQFSYVTNGDTLTLARYSVAGGAVAIPDAVDGLPVTCIGDSAFWNSSITGVTIPGSVTNIQDYAFYSCQSLSSVTIPSGVASIGNSAFLFCTGLTNVALSQGVTTIGSSAFWECGFARIAIPGSVTNIGSDAFDFCAGLGIASFGGNAPAAGSTVFAYDTNATVYYLPGTTGWSSTFGGVPAVVWDPVIQVGGPAFGARGDQFGFNITGTSNIVAVVETSTNPAAGVWISLQRITLTNGMCYFSEPVQTNGCGRFYHLSMP